MARPHQPIVSRYADLKEKPGYVRDLFNRGARYYDRVGQLGFWGTGHYYRKQALVRAGLRPGMAVLDVACGTGAVTRAIVEILQGSGTVLGVDPSEGMLAEARGRVPADFKVGRAEEIPAPDARFDFLAMGYALRHVQDLGAAFTEYRRVLKPGGRLLLLEITRPSSRAGLAIARLYFRDLLPRLSGWVTGSPVAREMMAYYWETIEACVPPAAILEALRETGFVEVRKEASLGIFSEYQAVRG